MLRLRLPLLVLLVLAPIVAALLWTASWQLEGILLNVGGGRAQTSAEQVAQVMAQNTSRGAAEIQRRAKLPAIRRALLVGDRASLDAAADRPWLPADLHSGIGPFISDNGLAAYLIVEAVMDPGADDRPPATIGALVVPRRLGGAPNAELLSRLGALAPIAGTPWFVLVDMPQALLLAPVRGVLWTIGGVAVAALALGVLATTSA